VKCKRARVSLLLLLAAVACGQAFGLHQAAPSQRVHRVSKRRTHLRRVIWNPVFRPSRDSLLRQNEEIDRLELPRIQNQAELDQLIAHQELVPIVANETLRFDPRLDPDRRYCRPWTRDFLDDVSEAYFKQFHSPIQVNSAVRTVQVQKKLRRHNRNAAPEKGETASSHLAGITVDIQRRGMTKQQVAWMEQYLMPLKDEGLVEPEEERHQWVFHVAVSGRYADLRESKELTGEQQDEAQDDLGTEPPSILSISDQQSSFDLEPASLK
jgi:Family of unknown function (DUF5715)